MHNEFGKYDSVNLISRYRINVLCFQVQYLVEALEILLESRRQLMFTYIFAYHIKSHNQKMIFENNQSDLETATEQLSKYLETDFKKDQAEEMKQNIINKSG